MKQIKQITTFSETVHYHPYEGNLPVVFEEIKNIIRTKLPHVHVEHVGSSSIPGVGGRNVIDMAIAAQEADQVVIKNQLCDLGFQDSPFEHYLPLLVGAFDFRGKEYAILLYVVQPDSDVYQGWIMFRDHMRVHPEDAQAYDQVKRQNIAAGLGEGGRYQEAKTPFLVSMMERIEQSAKD